MKIIKNHLFISLIFGIVISNSQKNNDNKNSRIIFPNTPTKNQSTLILEDHKVL